MSEKRQAGSERPGCEIEGGGGNYRLASEAPTPAPGATEDASKGCRFCGGLYVLKAGVWVCSECGLPEKPIDPNAGKPAPEWPAIPEWMVNPLVFRDKNLGIVLVAGKDGEQMIYRLHVSTPFPSTEAHWCSLRKVDERDGFQMVDALNLPNPISLPPVEVSAREVAPEPQPNPNPFQSKFVESLVLAARAAIRRKDDGRLRAALEPFAAWKALNDGGDDARK
jgi:hypothetical protein